MKLRIFFVSVILIATTLNFLFESTEADLPEDAYDMTKYDPKNDVMSIRTGGTILFTNSSDIEITKMTSRYILDNPLNPQIELKMTIEGTIQNHDDYRYFFIVIADGNEYIFLAFLNGTAIGNELGTDSLILGVIGDGEGTNTLTILFNLDSIGPPKTSFDFTCIAQYILGDHEQYIDMAPDKLILITEPSEGSTVNGVIVIKGVVRESTEDRPNGTVKIKIDDGSYENVTGNDTWSYSLDTTTLSEGKHSIYVKIEGENLENAKHKITIFVDQDTGNYKYFNNKPAPNVGDWYEYISIGQGNISGLPILLFDEMNVQVTDVVLIEIDGKDYEVYRIKYYTEYRQDFGYVAYSYSIDRISWRDIDHFGIVKEQTISASEKCFYPDTQTNTTTTYSPPLETHNGFNVMVGFQNKWTFNTEVDSISSTTIAGEGETQNPPFQMNFEVVGECLYYKDNHTVFGYTYNDIYVIKTYLENPGMSIIEYYSPELGVPVQKDMFDPSGNLISSIGLDNWICPPNPKMIEKVSFNPMDPQAEINNKVIIRVNNSFADSTNNLSITLKDGDIFVAQKIIPSIPPYNTQEITFDWIPKSKGNHTLTITLSYQDYAFEETNIEIYVELNDKENIFESIGFWIGILSLITIALIISGFIIQKRRKKK